MLRRCCISLPRQQTLAKDIGAGRQKLLGGRRRCGSCARASPALGCNYGYGAGKHFEARLGGAFEAHRLSSSAAASFGDRPRWRKSVPSMQWRGIALDNDTDQDAAPDPDMRSCRTIEELTCMAYAHIDRISPRGLSAYWALVSKFLHRPNHDNEALDTNEARRQHLQKMLVQLLAHTLKDIWSFGHRDMAQTTISLAKIVKHATAAHDRAEAEPLPMDDQSRVLHDLLVGQDSQNKRYIFDQIASASIPLLSKFDARHLSNFIYAFSTAECVPRIGADGYGRDSGRGGDGSSGGNEHLFFDVLAFEALPKLKDFNSHDLANVLWAFGSAGARNARLFEGAAERIVALDSLDGFDPQALSNILWSFATARVPHDELYDKAGRYVAEAGRLGRFLPQNLCNILWAFATAGQRNPRLFRMIANHILELDSMHDYGTQAISSIAWAYATARAPNPRLFEKLSVAAVEKQSQFSPQGIASFLWSCSGSGHTDPVVFSSLAPTVKCLLGKFSGQGLASIGWAYAVADVGAPSLFDASFVEACLEKEKDFTTTETNQLHQWQLWQNELGSGVEFPPWKGFMPRSSPRASRNQHFSAT